MYFTLSLVLKGDIQLLWNQFSELHEPQVFKSLLTTSATIIHQIIFNWVLLVLVFNELKLEMPTNYERCLFFLCAKIQFDSQCSDNRDIIFVEKCNDSVFILVVGVGRDLSPHYSTYLANYNRWWLIMISDFNLVLIFITAIKINAYKSCFRKGTSRQ